MFFPLCVGKLLLMPRERPNLGALNYPSKHTRLLTAVFCFLAQFFSFLGHSALLG
jgi:hypothetical protein